MSYNRAIPYTRPNAEDNANNAALLANDTMFAKALGGDISIVLSQATAAPTAAECAANAQVYAIGIALKTAAGEIHSWYNGKIKLAIADDDSAGTASIDPEAGEISMVNGEATVVVTMSKSAWTATKAATLTVSKPTSAKAPILETVADKTFVATVAA